MSADSKRVQRVVYLNFPAYTTVLNPIAFSIPDLSEPVLVEERIANAVVAISTTTAATPIVVNAPAHGYGTVGSQVQIQVTGVAGTPAPWGNWFVTIIDANNFSLNGSMTDGNAGTGGSAMIASQIQFTEVSPVDMNYQGLDGQPQQRLGSYRWANEQLQFRGSVNANELRITYWASGTPPTNASTTIGIDNCIDFLAVATAANAAYANGWQSLGDILKSRAYGDGGDYCNGGLLGKFMAIQVASLQRGPTRRRLPFRPHRYRYGDPIIF